MTRPAPSVRALTVVIAPDSFKGSLTSVEVARAMAAGWAVARPADTIRLAPLADGGEGTLVAVYEAGGWAWVESPASDPLGRPIQVRWLRSVDGEGAFVELAAASGLSRVRPDERDPLAASTFGTGEVLRAVLDAGIRRIVLGIGGSATTDGGSGILVALGARLLGAGEAEVAGRGGGVLADVAGVDLSGLDPRLAETELLVACDVSNPLLGPEGAAAVYGPQKGAAPEDVARLESGLARWADALEAATGRRERETPGAGAAGGVGFALLCLTDRLGSLGLEPGVELVMAQAGLERTLRAADLVLTGEGRIDAQTGFGKTALGVARLAAGVGVPCIAVGGGVEPDGAAALAVVGAIAVPVVESPISLVGAIAAGAESIERCGERLARLISIGARLG
ncbi:MAG TPA: glycerate kinase [Candidatus Dormibacteraeota bacterium]|nr:glycerate kinase [Candidatus Dormibacteraeota bacterium]